MIRWLKRWFYRAKRWPWIPVCLVMGHRHVPKNDVETVLYGINQFRCFRCGKEKPHFRMDYAGTALKISLEDAAILKKLTRQERRDILSELAKMQKKLLLAVGKQAVESAYAEALKEA